MSDQFGIKEGQIPFDLVEARKKASIAKEQLFSGHDEFFKIEPDPINIAETKFREGLQPYILTSLNLAKAERSHISNRNIKLAETNSAPSRFDYDQPIDDFQRALDYLAGKAESTVALEKIITGIINEKQQSEEKNHKAIIDRANFTIFGFGRDNEGIRQEEAVWKKQTEVFSRCLETVRNEPKKFRQTQSTSA